MPQVPMIFSSTPVWIPSVQWKSNIGFLPRLYKFLMPSPPACTLWKRAWKFPLICVLFLASSLYGGGYSAETQLQEATCSQPYACHMSQMWWNFTLFSSTKIHVRYLWLWRGKNRFIFLWRAVQLAMMTDTSLLCKHYTKRRGQQSIKSWRWKHTLSDRGDFWALSIEILVFASPTASMLTSFGFSILIWGIFHKFLWSDR